MFDVSGLTEMRAVKEQREKFWQLSSDFAQRLKFHLIDIFQRHVRFFFFYQSYFFVVVDEDCFIGEILE